MGLLPDWPWWGGTKGGTLALTLTDGAIRYVHASSSDEGGASITAWGVELRGNQSRDAFLAKLKGILPAAGRVIVVLDPADYVMLQVESPNVPVEELHGAMRWRAMEFMEGSPQDYTLDLLTLSPEPGRSADVIAAVALNEVLRSRLAECVVLDRRSTIIDVPETAMRNLLHAVLLDEGIESTVAAVLVASTGRALMVISVKGELYFFRRFEFDVDTLAVGADDASMELVGSSAGEESATRSLVQLHRSLDLWDLGYPNLPLATLRVDAGPKTAEVIDRLRPETGVETRPLALSKLFQLPVTKSAPPWQDPAFLPLLGALLRPKDE